MAPPSQARIGQSQSSTDDEQIVFPNAPITGTYLVQVFLYEDGGCPNGDTYDLTIQLN